MPNLKVFFRNFFDTPKISDNNIRKFAEDQLQRMISNNPTGIYNQLITDTTFAYNGYFGAISNEDVRTAIKEGSTIGMNNALKAFRITVSRKEGIIRGTYGKTSEVYQEFYPHGIMEYTGATLGNVQLLMERMVTASTAHAADLGAAFVTLFTNHRNNFNTLRTAQLNLIGEVAGKKDVSVTTRDVIEIQLMKNVLFIGFYNVGNLEAVNTYFDQSIIRPDKDSATDGLGRAKGKIKDPSGNPIKGVEVEAVGAGVAKSHSNAEGNFRTRNLDTSNHQFKFSKPGWQTLIVSKEIVDDGDTLLDVTMQPIAPTPAP